MTDLHLHHDLYHEASSRRSRQAERHVRDRQHQRSAIRAAATAAPSGIRVRFIAQLARIMGVAEQFSLSAATRRPTATRHGR